MYLKNNKEMILFNKYKTVRCYDEPHITVDNHYKKIQDIICNKKNILYIGDKYTYFQCNNIVNITNFPYYVNHEYYKSKIGCILNKKFKIFMQMDKNYTFSKRVIRSSNLWKYTIFNIPINPKKIFMDIICNNILYIKYIRCGYDSMVFICVENSNIKHSRCGYTKNKKITRLLVREILKNDNYDTKIKTLLLNYFKWKGHNYYGRDAIQLLETHIKINEGDMDAYYVYIISSTFKDQYDNNLVHAIINYFKKYIVRNGLNKFIDDIIIKKLKQYDMKRYEKILTKFIYNNELFDNIIFAIYPDAVKKILKYLIECKNSLKIQLNGKIQKNNTQIQIDDDNINTSDLQSQIDNCDNEFKKYTSDIEKYIRKIKVYKINIYVLIRNKID